MSGKRIYETILVHHPDMSEEEVETGLKSTVELLETNGSEIIRTERGGKRRLAYMVQKQRYGYYNLIHYRGTSEALVELERAFRLNDRVLRYLTVRFDKEDQLTGLTRMGDDEGRDDERDDRRRGGRRGDFGGPRGGRDRGRDRDMPLVEDSEFSDDPELEGVEETAAAVQETVDAAVMMPEEAVPSETETEDSPAVDAEQA